ncbi:RluA family pseudouridine synthase [Endozoicomonas numazuensis]|uniref:Pseudouridine synthase RsuA/RluA-like domain-containing protein n=1 Tax=Endozoicomonas numazuensis TaxID=1137799 RepID=A0A081N003_9GAMM|nr:RluA family pseudouridine synthase [Endozoicomonas numazuensis]KEQ11776.1 hypothetical protein GZ78_28405 [Endozoicomonas numazuensis]
MIFPLAALATQQETGKLPGLSEVKACESEQKCVRYFSPCPPADYSFDFTGLAKLNERLCRSVEGQKFLTVCGLWADRLIQEKVPTLQTKNLSDLLEQFALEATEEEVSKAINLYHSMGVLRCVLAALYASSDIPEDREVQSRTLDLWASPAIKKMFERNAAAIGYGQFNTLNKSLNVLYKDDDILIVCKPPYQLSHPLSEVPGNSLMNVVLHHYPENRSLPRGGLAHRLDRDSSGNLAIGLNYASLVHLIDIISRHECIREYEAIVEGGLESDSGVIDCKVDTPFWRKSKQLNGVTRFTVIERFKNFTHVLLRLETGRRHQIRAHMAKAMNHPLVGDRLYNPRYKSCAVSNEKGALELGRYVNSFCRQALHSRRISFKHPRYNHSLDVTSKLPEDFQSLLFLLRKDAKRPSHKNPSAPSSLSSGNSSTPPLDDAGSVPGKPAPDASCSEFP